MKLLSYTHNGTQGWGYLSANGDEICPVKTYAGASVPMLKDFIEGGFGRFDASKAQPGAGGAFPLKDALLLAPVTGIARNILCVGKNYFDHIAEFDKKTDNKIGMPQHPAYFTKSSNTLNGPYSDIPSHAGITSELDYEAELAVIIGKKGVNIAPADVMDHIFGYTILNDVTARDLQRNHLQWFKGKSLDGFCPMGPWIVTCDELTDPGKLSVRSLVNGEVRQDSNTASMIFDIPTLVSVLSQGFTLLPGDVLATGTPSGVGMGFDPPRLLSRGDTVRVEIERIGFISNKVS